MAKVAVVVRGGKGKGDDDGARGPEQQHQQHQGRQNGDHLAPEQVAGQHGVDVVLESGRPGHEGWRRRARSRRAGTWPGWAPPGWL